MTAMRVVHWAIGAVLTALYAYATVAAVGNLIGMAEIFGSVLRPAAWIVLGIGVAAPATVYVLALIIARGKGAGMRLLIIAAGLCVCAAIQLDVLHLMG